MLNNIKRRIIKKNLEKIENLKRYFNVFIYYSFYRMYMCVCVCVCPRRENKKERTKDSKSFFKGVSFLVLVLEKNAKIFLIPKYSFRLKI